MPRWNYPLDPECPEVRKFEENTLNDPMTRYAGIGDELSEDFQRRHQSKCERCQEFGAANVEVI